MLSFYHSIHIDRSFLFFKLTYTFLFSNYPLLSTTIFPLLCLPVPGKGNGAKKTNGKKTNKKNKTKAKKSNTISKNLKTSRDNGNSLPKKVADDIVNEVKCLQNCFNALGPGDPARKSQRGRPKYGFEFPQESYDRHIKELQTNHLQYSKDRSAASLRVVIQHFVSGIGTGCFSGKATALNPEVRNENQRQYETQKRAVVKKERLKNNVERVRCTFCFFFFFLFFLFF